MQHNRRLTAQRHVLDLRPAWKKLRRLRKDIPLDEFALYVLLPLLARLVRGGLEQDWTVADLRKHTDECERLSRRVADEVVQLVGREDLVEDVPLELRRIDENNIFV